MKFKIIQKIKVLNNIKILKLTSLNECIHK